MILKAIIRTVIILLIIGFVSVMANLASIVLKVDQGLVIMVALVVVVFWLEWLELRKGKNP